MDKYFGLDTLMEVKGLTSNERFSAYYKNILAPREKEALNLLGFTKWDVPQVGFTYEQLELENQITAMATYVDLNSDPIALGTKVGDVLRGSIPRQKARFTIGEEDYRKQMIVLERMTTAARFTGEDAGKSVKNYLAKLLFGGLSELQDAHIASLNYQVGQMKSAGKVALTDANNPRGIRNIEFSAYVPAENVTTLSSTKRWFTNDGKTTEGSTATPVEDVKNLIRAAKERYTDVVLEVDEKSFFEDMKHSAWKKALGYQIMPTLMAGGVSSATDTAAQQVASASSDEQVKAAFRAIVGVPVEFSQTVCGVEKWDSSANKLVRTKLRAFNPNVYLARPAGEIGIIKNVVPLRPDGSAISTLILDNHGIIEYRYDEKHKVQDWVSELTALAVPTRPRDMFYLKTY
jgi:hypothetical protein